MNNEFKKIKSVNETRYVLESSTGGSTDSSAVTSNPSAGFKSRVVQRRVPGQVVTQEAEKGKVPPPRDPVAKNLGIKKAGRMKNPNDTKDIPRKEKHKGKPFDLGETKKLTSQEKLANRLKKHKADAEQDLKFQQYQQALTGLSNRMPKKKTVPEEWSQKYKNSINCSHPKGFSQRAHCAGKKKHNEDTTMEITCPDCGLCEAHGNSKIYDKCWTGFRKVPGKTRGEKGSCKKIGKSVEEGLGDFIRSNTKNFKNAIGMGSGNPDSPFSNEKDIQQSAMPVYQDLIKRIAQSGGIEQQRTNGLVSTAERMLQHIYRYKKTPLTKQNYAELVTDRIKADVARAMGQTGVMENMGKEDTLVYDVTFADGTHKRVRVRNAPISVTNERIKTWLEKEYGKPVAKLVHDASPEGEPEPGYPHKPEPHEPGGAAHNDTGATDRAISRFDRQVPESVGGVAETTGDEAFKNMLKKISKVPTAKQRNAERIRLKREREKVTRDRTAGGTFGDMFVGGNPAANLSVKKTGVAEDGEGTPEGLPHLTPKLLKHIVQQIGTDGVKALVKSLKWGDGAAVELLDLITQDLKDKIGMAENQRDTGFETSEGWGMEGYATYMRGKGIPEDIESDTYMQELDSKLAEKLNPNDPVDVWELNFKNADPNKYHQFKNQTPEEKEEMARTARFAAINPSKK